MPPCRLLKRLLRLARKWWGGLGVYERMFQQPEWYSALPSPRDWHVWSGGDGLYGDLLARRKWRRRRGTGFGRFKQTPFMLLP